MDHIDVVASGLCVRLLILTDLLFGGSIAC
jgi:hypothetical protein